MVPTPPATTMKITRNARTATESTMEDFLPLGFVNVDGSMVFGSRGRLRVDKRGVDSSLAFKTQIQAHQFERQPPIIA
jgi:hypothetical protein